MCTSGTSKSILAFGRISETRQREALSRILNLVNKHNPLHADYFEMPWEIILKKAVISVHSMDGVLRVIGGSSIPKRYVDRKSLYPHYTAVLNSSIKFPITFKELKNSKISTMCTASKISRSFLYGSQVIKRRNINLLYLQNPRDDSISHFARIKNLSCLMRSQITGKKTKKYFYDRYNK